MKSLDAMLIRGGLAWWTAALRALLAKNHMPFGHGITMAHPAPQLLDQS